MTTLSEFFYKKTNIYWCILSTILTFAFLYLIIGAFKSCTTIDPEIVNEALSTGFGYTYKEALNYFSSHPTEAISCYNSVVMFWDNSFPIFYGLMYILWLSLIWKKNKTKSKYLKYINLVPLGNVIFDWLENIQGSMLAKSYAMDQAFSKVQVSLASTTTIIKWSFSSLSFILVIIGVIILLVQYLKRNKKLKFN